MGSRLFCYASSVRILVTGSTGHLGEALVRSLRDDSHEVVGLDQTERAVPEPGARGKLIAISYWDLWFAMVAAKDMRGRSGLLLTRRLH